MRLRDKIEREVAKKLGLTIEQVKGVVKNNFDLATETMSDKDTFKTIYIRKVGFFMHMDNKIKLGKESAARKKAKRLVNMGEDTDSEPLEF